LLSGNILACTLRAQVLSGNIFARFASCDIRFFNMTCSTFMHTLKVVTK